jgi:hypothetical protein
VLWVDRVGPFNNPQVFYMYNSLPFCRPDELKGKLEGLGESLLGYELRHSTMAISFAGAFLRPSFTTHIILILYLPFLTVPTRSGEVCEKTLSGQEAATFAYTIQNQFWYQMFLGKAVSTTSVTRILS